MQVKQAPGCESKREIRIFGLAGPMFRAAEAIMKYFGGYYKMHITDDIALPSFYLIVTIINR